MTCNKIKYQLPDFINQKLSEEESGIISGHLLVCRDCQKEAEQLRFTIAHITESKVSVPSNEYFNGLLPGIHERIEQKPPWAIPEWAIRYVMPLGAAAVAVLMLLRIGSPDTETVADIQSIVRSLQSDEIQQVEDQQTLAEIAVATQGNNETTVALLDEDIELVKEFISDNAGSLLYSSLDLRSVTENLNDSEVDELMAYLQTEPGIN